MRVRQADALRVKGVCLDHMPHFAELRHFHFKQCFHFAKSLSPILQRTKRNLRDDKGVHQNLSPAEALLHRRAAVSKVLNPDGCVGKDHRLER